MSKHIESTVPLWNDMDFLERFIISRCDQSIPSSSTYMFPTCRATIWIQYLPHG